MIKVEYIASLAKDLKLLTTFFLLALSIGFYLGLDFVNETTNNQAQGIAENYNGNGDEVEAETMKFRKSEYVMYNILHTHFLSLSVILFILGFLTYGASIHLTLRRFQTIEPLVSVILNFGGISFIN